MARASLDVRWNRLILIGGAIGMAAGSRLLAADSAWLAPVSGSFFDPARWSAGVPTSTSAVTFGGASSDEPFVVSIAQPAIVKSLTIVNQSPRIEIAASPPFGLQINSALSVTPGSPMISPAMFSGGVLSAGTTSFNDGAWVEFENVDATLAGVQLTNGAMLLRDGSSMQVSSLTVKTFQDDASLDLFGPDTSLHAAGKVSAIGTSGTASLRLADGAVLSALSVSWKYAAPIAFEIGPSGPGRIEATTTFRGAGPLELSVTDASSISPNTWMPLIATSDIVFDVHPVSVTSPLPYPPILRTSASGLEVMFPDHVDRLTIEPPTFAVPGYGFACKATATIDGVEYDVSQTASWQVDSDNGSFAVPSEWTPARAGPAEITVHFGDRAASAIAVASALLPPHQVVDATAIDGGVPNGVSGEGTSRYGRSVSRDGTRVVFASRATNLVSTPALPTDAPEQVYLWDAASGSRTLLSQTAEGVPSPAKANRPVISLDGRFVAFVTTGQLTAVPHADLGSVPYVRDLVTGTIEPLIVNAQGAAASGAVAALSDGGRFALVSTTEAIAPGGIAGHYGTYRLDRWLGTAVLVSANADGTSVAYDSIPVDMTADGASAAFFAEYFSEDSQHFQGDFFVKRLNDGTLIHVNAPLQSLSVYDARVDGALSSDGRYAAFLARATSLGAPGGFEQAFVRDLDTGELTAISKLPDGTWANGSVNSISMSEDARFVAFAGGVSSLLPSPLPPVPEGPPFLTGLSEAFMLDRITGELQVLTQAPNGEYCFPLSEARWTGVSGDGRTVAFTASNASILPFTDVDVRRVLLRRSTSWVAGDANRDGTVNGADIARVIEVWGTADIGADLNLDNTVDARDLALVLGAFGA